MFTLSLETASVISVWTNSRTRMNVVHIAHIASKGAGSKIALAKRIEDRPNDFLMARRMGPMGVSAFEGSKYGRSACYRETVVKKEFLPDRRSFP